MPVTYCLVCILDHFIFHSSSFPFHLSFFIFSISSFILHLFHFIFHPSSFLFHPTSFPFHLSYFPIFTSSLQPLHFKLTCLQFCALICFCLFLSVFIRFYPLPPQLSCFSGLYHTLFHLTISYSITFQSL